MAKLCGWSMWLWYVGGYVNRVCRWSISLRYVGGNMWLGYLGGVCSEGMRVEYVARVYG